MLTDLLYVLAEVLTILLVKKYCYFRLHCTWFSAIAAALVFRLFDYALLVILTKLSEVTTGLVSLSFQLSVSFLPLPLAAIAMLVFSCICIPKFHLNRNSDFWIVSASLIFSLAIAHAFLYYLWLMLLVLLLGGANQSYQSYRPYHHRDHYY